MRVIAAEAGPSSAESLALGPPLVLQHSPSFVRRAEVEEDRRPEGLCGGWPMAREYVHKRAAAVASVGSRRRWGRRGVGLGKRAGDEPIAAPSVPVLSS